MLFAKEYTVFLRFTVWLGIFAVVCATHSYSPDDPRHYSSLSSSASTKTHSSASQVAKMDGDVFLGGLFPVHAKGNGSTLCGELNEQVGIHRVEAMLYAIDQVNNNSNLLPNITLGMEIRDDCGTVNTALEQCLNFVLGTLTNKEQICSSLQGPAAVKKKATLVGVVGPSYSITTIQVASLLRLFDVPQVSYAATSAELSDKGRFEYFARTVPPDSFQARAMVDIITYMNWTAVFVVHSRGSYGEQGMEILEEFSKQANVCIADHRQLEPDFTLEDYDQIIDKFLKENDIRVVVMFCNSEDLRSMLLAAKRAQNRGVKKRFIWLASDFWGTKFRHLEGLEDIADGAITFEFQTFDAQLKPFYDYFSKLKPLNNSRNPWFKEYWEKRYGCDFGNDSSPENQCGHFPDNHTSVLHRFDAKVPFVIDAVFSFAHALHNMQRNVCGSVPGLCPEMGTLDRTTLLQYLRNVSFNGTTGLVRFDENGDSAGKYDVYVFKKSRSNSYQKLGSWIEGELTFDSNELFHGDTSLESHCGKPCGPRAIKRMRVCCWTCENCDADSYVANEFTCQTCDKGKKPNATFNGCEPLHEVYLNSVWIAVVVTSASLGILATFIVCAVFIKFAKTPLIKASGHELSIVLLLGIILCYGFAFIMVSYPNTVVCAFQRFGIGLCFCVCYASLLVRTNRIARIFSGVKTPSFISPKSQLLITAVIIAPELAMAITELSLRPPKAVASYEQKDFVLIKCNISTAAMVSLFGYNAFLIILCTFYAFRTRKTPLNFNEAKFIGFCMYTTCVIWIAFVPVYYGIGGGFQAVALAFSSIISATTILIFIFLPKVYIVLFKPEKNIRSNSRLRSRTKSLDFNQPELDEVCNGQSYRKPSSTPATPTLIMNKMVNGGSPKQSHLYTPRITAI
ncbi:metabotropic glutamate receptor 3-like [Oculina patagonica]